LFKIDNSEARKISYQQSSGRPSEFEGTRDFCTDTRTQVFSYTVTTEFSK